MEKKYKTRGVCSSEIDITLDGDRIKKVVFKGGCDGNTKGIQALVEGMTKEDVIKKLSGIDCKGRGTSCPDQLARALNEMEEQ